MLRMLKLKVAGADVEALIADLVEVGFPSQGNPGNVYDAKVAKAVWREEQTARRHICS